MFANQTVLVRKQLREAGKRFEFAAAMLRDQRPRNNALVNQ